MAARSAKAGEHARNRVDRLWNQAIWSFLAALAVYVDFSVLVAPFLVDLQSSNTPAAFVAGLFTGVAISGLIIAMTRG